MPDAEFRFEPEYIARVREALPDDFELCALLEEHNISAFMRAFPERIPRVNTSDTALLERTATPEEVAQLRKELQRRVNIRALYGAVCHMHTDHMRAIGVFKPSRL